MTLHQRSQSEFETKHNNKQQRLNLDTASIKSSWVTCTRRSRRAYLRKKKGKKKHNKSDDKCSHAGLGTDGLDLGAAGLEQQRAHGLEVDAARQIHPL